MAMLQSRHAECVATLDRERTAVEVVFRSREDDGTEYLWWFSLKGSDGAGPEGSPFAIDADHDAQARRTKERGWVEAEPQVVLLPEPVRQVIESWSVRDTGPAAWAVAEAVRELTLCTEPLAAPGLADPGDVSAVLAGLVTATERLPQALGQSGSFLERAADAGHLRAASGIFTDDVPAAVTTAGEWLDRAAGLTGRLTEALRNAQLAVSGLPPPVRPTRSETGQARRRRLRTVAGRRDVRRLAGHPLAGWPPAGSPPAPASPTRSGSGSSMAWLDTGGGAEVAGDPLS
jgi:hypothetical protein